MATVEEEIRLDVSTSWILQDWSLPNIRGWLDRLQAEFFQKGAQKRTEELSVDDDTRRALFVSSDVLEAAAKDEIKRQTYSYTFHKYSLFRDEGLSHEDALLAMIEDARDVHPLLGDIYEIYFSEEEANFYNQMFLENKMREKILIDGVNPEDAFNIIALEYPLDIARLEGLNIKAEEYLANDTWDLETREFFASSWDGLENLQSYGQEDIAQQFLDAYETLVFTSHNPEEAWEQLKRSRGFSGLSSESLKTIQNGMPEIHQRLADQYLETYDRIFEREECDPQKAWLTLISDDRFPARGNPVRDLINEGIEQRLQDKGILPSCDSNPDTFPDTSPPSILQK